MIGKKLSVAIVILDFLQLAADKVQPVNCAVFLTETGDRYQQFIWSASTIGDDFNLLTRNRCEIAYLPRLNINNVQVPIFITFIVAGKKYLP